MSNVYLSSAQTSTVAQTVTGLFPLAQTFVIDNPGGAFVTSLDLFFESKDPSLPVTIQLRSIENGAPSGIILPFSNVTVAAASVQVSADASVPTKFTFDAPIYLLDTAEYCFEITANSHLYTVWAAELGGYDVSNAEFSITKQPYSGVMFKAQNASTWTPELTKDIKFTLRRADFVPSGTIILNEAPIPAITLDANPLETYTEELTVTTISSLGSNTITVFTTDTVAVGDLITITGAVGTEEEKLIGSWLVTGLVTGPDGFTIDIDDNVVSGTYPTTGTSLGTYVRGLTTVRVYHKDHGHIDTGDEVTIAGVVDPVNGIPITSINGTHTVLSVEQDSYTFEISSYSDAATTAGRSGGSTVTATENRLFDVLYPNVQQLQFQAANADWYIRTTDGKSLAGSETPGTTPGATYTQIAVNSNTYLDAPKIIRSNAEEPNFYLKGEFSTNNTAISPVIDLNRASIVTISNRIDNPASVASSGYNAVQNYQAETTAIGSSTLSKYITRRIDLSNPAAAIRMYISVNRPVGSDIGVYYKVLTTDNTDADFDSIGWTLVNPASPLPTSTNSEDYTEIEYDVTETDLSNKLFTAFAVKIAFFSTNSALVPSCHDFRAIAIT